jgi:methylmalonyl-CoA/ethylmalonyl-CoA epimerase
MPISESTNPARLSSIGQISIAVKDLARAVAFYRDKLQLLLLFEVPNLAFFDCGGVRLMLSIPENDASAGTSVLYYKVADIEGACAGLKSRGVEFEAEPHLIAKMPDHDLWMAFCRDSEANLVGLMCERPRQ